VTMFIGHIDLSKGSLDFCNAGHNPPFLTDAGGGKFLDMIPNAPIGLWPGLEYDGERLEDISGQMLVVYTDGLNEAENKQQEQFGDDHLLDILETMPRCTAKEMIDTLYEAVLQHRNGAEPNDDLTIMSIQVNTRKKETKK